MAASKRGMGKRGSLKGTGGIMRFTNKAKDSSMKKVAPTKRPMRSKKIQSVGQ